jgi:hypothetical protein
MMALQIVIDGKVTLTTVNLTGLERRLFITRVLVNS